MNPCSYRAADRRHTTALVPRVGPLHRLTSTLILTLTFLLRLTLSLFTAFLSVFVGAAPAAKNVHKRWKKKKKVSDYQQNNWEEQLNTHKRSAFLPHFTSSREKKEPEAANVLAAELKG